MQHDSSNATPTRAVGTSLVNPFRTAVPFGGKTTWNLSGLSSQRDCSPNSPERVKELRQSKTISPIFSSTITSMVAPVVLYYTAVVAPTRAL